MDLSTILHDFGVTLRGIPLVQNYVPGKFGCIPPPQVRVLVKGPRDFEYEMAFDLLKDFDAQLETPLKELKEALSGFKETGNDTELELILNDSLVSDGTVLNFPGKKSEVQSAVEKLFYQQQLPGFTLNLSKHYE